MRVPLSWLREYVDLPATETGRDVQAKLVAVGLEVETVEQIGAGLKGPLVVGQVLTIEELEGFKKPIRFCTVDVGSANGTGEPQEIVCGARNFAVGDKVVVVLPGAVLPGDFAIAARKTYGRTSHGMICSTDELGMGDDGTHGIIVLPPEHEVGTDAIELLELVDEVLDIAVTPDRGYCLSMRGVARETAIAYGLPLRDPALLDVPAPNAFGYPVKIADPIGCDRFTARTVVGLEPEARSPIWLQRRLQKAGMRPISLAVDITNYVMLELGQPLHAYDRTRVDGPIGVRRAQQGEKLTTLDGTVRVLDAEDLVITDDRGPIGLAGVMGGANTEIADVKNGENTTEVVIEAAHFDAISIARTARRHKLSSEASKRFERGVDPQAAAAAAQRTVDLLVLLAGGTAEAGVTEVTAPSAPRTIAMPADHPDRVAGVAYGRETVVRRLQQVGCDVYGQDELLVTVPSWRPDLSEPNDLAEEVIRLEGYENLPSTLPTPPSGRGLTDRQRLHRRFGRALAGAGYVEALNYPFIGDAVLDQLGLDADDARRRTVKLVNPLSDEEPALRTTLLPGLLGALRRNDGRGSHDLALFETGLVFRPTGDETRTERLTVDRRPTDDEIAGLNAALPRQPRRAAVVLAGAREQAGWWGKGRPADWADSIEAARTIAREAGVELTVRSDQHAPWHPGRCAALFVTSAGEETLVGHAGELHPRVIKELHLPERTCAMEIELDLLEQAVDGALQAPRISTFPVATQDVALIVAQDVPATTVEEALRAGAGQLLESLRLFDVFTGDQIGEGKKSLAYALRFRAPDRTLTVDEATAARDAAVALAAERTGAVLRGA
ncbi:MULTISPECIES: phenylalanine--tRNA ligase subunit beta [unclassified Streptomyces]|jgi:phenylalanyl-tRNA synthetase beta chain|uniref:phenylalanine--tRNA ligase subunit beta n=1 Tax=unclassified Streptomyces TaxID=2593676 RepID=UPI000884F2D0|nr:MULTISPECIES: phenylalanine--tRNA ligase subunit beta [unclassified Streptomyces]MDX2729527.1 phenylalanine--tRNA ligase subunit beta [Streptomyces sp. PA03-2a]MDX3765474.1 phenylalanine--tRNA ligase subunit beta [Streptomyces sp. AK08-01B]MDX3815053.1 phenylalanine--tRNA ligase subunit beta [Streptomyces sp. AK08-01A]SCY94333.1 phenylalanyl-tRNA synthetase beta subunit [Streptomyces sp. 136MFCol5.1]SFS98196.1 phenylalanyl-tRNA synthetase beta subunit [Streptomyces sp. ok210]